MPVGPRSDIYDRNEIGVYHCFNNVVQGLDLLAERRFWIENRLSDLASIFAVDVFTFAVLDTHYHSVLRNRPDVVSTWTDEEVISRWLRLSSQSLQLKEGPSEEKIAKVLRNPEKVAEWRLRLGDISWFMRMLNEPMARAINKAREKKGHVWRERFKMQVLADEEAVLACALYVDLNPIRATMADSLEESEHTGIWLRMRAIAERAKQVLSEVVGNEHWMAKNESGWLLPISVHGDGLYSTGRRCSDKGIFEFSVEEYLGLADRVARLPALGKPGMQSPELPPILERMRHRLGAWLAAVQDFSKRMGRVVGRSESIQKISERRKRSFRGRRRRNRNAFD